jgi:hypothetical protein
MKTKNQTCELCKTKTAIREHAQEPHYSFIETATGREGIACATDAGWLRLAMARGFAKRGQFKNFKLIKKATEKNGGGARREIARRAAATRKKATKKSGLSMARRRAIARRAVATRKRNAKRAA